MMMFIMKTTMMMTIIQTVPNCSTVRSLYIYSTFMTIQMMILMKGMMTLMMTMTMQNVPNCSTVRSI